MVQLSYRRSVHQHKYHKEKGTSKRPCLYITVIMHPLPRQPVVRLPAHMSVRVRRLYLGVLQDEEDAEDADETQQSSIDNYTGVSIRVSSLSAQDELCLTVSMSGLLQLEGRRRSAHSAAFWWAKIFSCPCYR